MLSEFLRLQDRLYFKNDHEEKCLQRTEIHLASEPDRGHSEAALSET